MKQATLPSSIDDLQALLEQEAYIADSGLATSVYLALKLQRPLLLEGEAGVGKTEVAKVLASGLDRELIRLQCYEGLDINHAVYEWNYARQLLEIRLMEASGSVDRQTAARQLFTEEFLIQRRLLRALSSTEERSPSLHRCPVRRLCCRATSPFSFKNCAQPSFTKWRVFPKRSTG